jgi:hypothetical protein
MKNISKLVFISFFLTLTSIWADSPSDKLNSGADPEIRKFLDDFFGKVIFSRDVRFASDYFASEAEYISLKKVKDLPNSIKKDNYAVNQKGFNDDCGLIMDLLPKVDVKSFTKVGLQKVEMSIDPEKTESGVEYEIKYSYEYSTNKFEFVTPTIVKFNGKPKFVSRFWIPLRFTL